MIGVFGDNIHEGEQHESEKAVQCTAFVLDNKKKDVMGERKTRNMVEKLKLSMGTVNKMAEAKNKEQAVIKK